MKTVRWIGRYSKVYKKKCEIALWCLMLSYSKCSFGAMERGRILWTASSIFSLLFPSFFKPIAATCGC
jgi:hypothetical protein